MRTIVKTSPLIVFLVGFTHFNAFQQCFTCGEAKGPLSSAFGFKSEALLTGSMAFGYNAIASNAYSTAIGLYSTASGGQSCAFGQYAIASANQSYAFGKYITSAASGAITIGSGEGGDLYTLVNTKPNCLMVGFRSYLPTFYVGPPAAGETTGFVGISTSDPQQRLHVDGNFLITGDYNGLLFADKIPRPGSTAIADFGIEYFRNGLNFWKPGGPGHYGSNYNLFLHDDGNVGIGTGEPTAKLHVEGSTILNGALTVSSLATEEGTKVVVVDNSGFLSNADMPAGDNLGSHIATRNLQMSGKFITHDNAEGNTEGIFVSPSGNVGIKTSNIADNDDLTIMAQITKDANVRIKGQGTKSSMIWTCNGNRSFGVGVNATECAFYEGTTKVMKIIGSKIGIGLPDGQAMPGDYKLYVAEGIMTEAVKVKLKGSWSDYVFSNDYRLMPLKDLETFVVNNKHLPDVPTENEVRTEGIDVAETNALLLKKIEELTLYIINQEKRIVELEQVIMKK